MPPLAKIPNMDPEAPPPLAAPPTMDGPPPDMGVTPAPMVSRIPTQGEQNIAHDQARLQKVQWAQEHPWGTPENHPGKLGKVAHVFSTLGNIAGDIVAPNVMANIPQTQLGMKTEEGQLAKRIGTEQSAESENKEREALTNKANVETGLEPGKAASTEALQGVQTDKAKEDLAQGPTLARSLDYYVNRALQEHRDPQEDPQVQHIQDAIANQKPGKTDTEETKTQTFIPPGGKTPMTYQWNPQTKKFDIPLGEHYERPITIKTGDSAHEFAELERGRGLLDKAEATYRTAQQGANGLKAMIDDAAQGGKMSARMLPLEGALEITTSQGVHRINRTEVDQFAGGGSAFDRLAGALKGGGTGIPFTREILGSMKHLADIQEKGAYDTYKGAYDSATRRYHLADEKPLNGPGGGGGSAAPAGADNEVYVGGKLVGHTVAGKYVPLAK